MVRPAIPAFTVAEQSLAKQALVVTGASLFVALCARLSVPLPFTPVPLTLGNLAVLLAGLVLGSRRGAAALMLYLAEGAAGLPFFAGGAAGAAQLFGPTGGYLLAYPAAAFLAGWLWERAPRSFGHAALAALAGELMLFAGGIAGLMVLTRSLPQAAMFGLYPFVFAEIIKIMTAAGAANRLRR
jgi:biotin transport system substrate-specific component